MSVLNPMYSESVFSNVSAKVRDEVRPSNQFNT